MTRARTIRHAVPLAIVAALLLGGCSVDVEGAPCREPFETTDCPAGQACGNDLRCSARALACGAGRCTPGVDPTTCSTVTQTATRCDRSDPVCGRWVEDDCGGRGMHCGTRGGGCECPEYIGTVVVAGAGGSLDRNLPPYPRGQASPPECRFGKLADALFLATTTGPATVQVVGNAGAQVVFGSATAESWPLTVRPNVTVLPAPAGATVIRGAPGAAKLAVVQGVLQGVRVESGGATGTGVELACGASGVPALRGVSVDGGGVLDPSNVVAGGLASGIAVTGACGARITGAAVTAVSGPGLAIEPTGAASVVVLGGTFGGSEIGIRIRGGAVTIASDPDGASTPIVSGNAGEGVVFGGSAPPVTVDATLDRAVVAANGGVGVVLENLVVGSSKVRILGCDVTGNGEGRPRFTGNVVSLRQVGGALVKLNRTLQTFAFHGNRLWSNAGDQLAFETDELWSIAAPACGAESNVFGGRPGAPCIPNGSFGVRVFSAGQGQVQAGFNVWPGTNPGEFISPSGVEVPSGEFCDAEPGVPPRPTCP